ncbi:uncharacterized protein LOC129856819 [Salvelinus fontinalis]|uniref:uncharacterized protein LOC129856819 n=1 Tax=Salvelinus fontinalis TaxID=8038 RepID=UPI00248638DD|nr:uncharacterized protein LOC129856819 [Salvelinus fontinalis]
MLGVSLCLFLLPLCAISMLSGWVESPGYPRGYPPDASLNWSRCAPPGHTLALRLTHLDMEDSDGCENDALEIFADGKHIALQCGEMSFEDLDSTVNPSLLSSVEGCLSLSFRSDYSNTKRHTGFRGFYMLQDFDECEEDPDNGCTQFCHNYIGGYLCSCRLGYHLDTDGHTCTVSCTEDLSGSLRGVISSPSRPGPYAEHAHCSYILSVEDNLELLLHFTGEFDVEQGPDGQCVDTLMVETSAGTQGPFCGRVPPSPPLRTGSHHARILFNSDGQGSNNGFTIHYRTTTKTCRGIVTSNSTLVPQQPKYHQGDTVTVTCDLGSVLNTGDKEYESTCQRTGEWSPVYRCEPVDCGEPDTSSDEALQLVDKDPSTLFHDKVQFKCESKYYTLEGDEKYICDASGTWTSVKGQEKLPKCIEVCGKTETDISSFGRILGGSQAKMGEIPWQLLTKQPKRGGASLINDRWAITAAHVVDGNEESKLTFFGGLIDGTKAKDTDPNVVIMVTDKIIIHPDYMKGIAGDERINYDNDIALIRMSSRVKLGPNVLPICLPEADGGFKEHQQGTVSGWGGTENKNETKILDKSKFLLHTSVGRYPKIICEDTPVLSITKPMVFTENMFCAGGDGTDSCKGDSGGPLFLPMLGLGNKDNRGPYRLRGIVSWGSLCELGKDSKKGYYTKVENYLDWIKKTIEREEQGCNQVLHSRFLHHSLSCPITVMDWVYSTLWLLGVSVCEFWVPVSSAVIGCGEPEPLLNGRVAFIFGSQNQHLSVIQYHCNEQFYSLPEGHNGNFTCSSDGQWKDRLNSSLIPQCIPVCGRPTVNLPRFGRIWGGKPAPAGSFPWQVLLIVNGRGGGIVIGDRWIMTAAHVLDRYPMQFPMVYVGHNNVENLLQSPTLEVASVHIHSDYNNVDDVNYDHDIALIHLKHPITFNAHIMPLCLPPKDAKYPTWRNGLISGFGLKENEMSTNNLMYVPLPVVNQTICRNSIDRVRMEKNISLTDNMFCAGNSEGGKDSCRGDSGGAYVLKEGNYFWAAGIVSWGIKCGEPGKYGVYTRVANYVDWIKKTIEEEEQKTICGRPLVSLEIHQRILGGEVAPKGTFPWQMLLSVEGGRSGGMVIGDRWILTAAHGVVHQHNNQVIKKSEVMAYVGDNNVENLLQSPPLEVASLHPHPGYNNTDGLSFNHDIALIKLQHPLTFSSSIMRVCLPEKGAEYSTGRVGWVSGFGLKDDDEMPSNLRYVRIPLVDQVKCRSSIDEARKKKREAPDLTDGMFCAGLPEGGKDTCAGDGGGPYVLKYGGVFWAAGIASWGIDCGEPGQYGVYTRVANYVDWIKKTMEN